LIPPFVVCISGSRKGVGKTSLGISIIGRLISQGIKVAAIKHCHEPPVLGAKDSEKYFAAGCTVSIAVSQEIIAKLARSSAPLKDLAYSTRCPIVIAEGFKKEHCDLKIAVVNSCREIAEVVRGAVKVDVVVSREVECVDGMKILGFDDVERIVSMIVERAKNHARNFVAGLNCAKCGYSTCDEAIHAWLHGASVDCLSFCRVRILVDGVSIPMNRFVCSLLESTLLSFLSNLRGFRRNAKNITIEILRESNANA